MRNEKKKERRREKPQTLTSVNRAPKTWRRASVSAMMALVMALQLWEPAEGAAAAGWEGTGVVVLSD
jgi:hypothetical protein